MDRNSAQHSSVSIRVLAAAGVLALVLAGCGEKPPAAPAPTPTPQAAVPAPAAPPPQAQPAPEPVQAVPKPDPDKALAATVHQALRAALGSIADGIDVTASGGTVTLWGTVPKAATRKKAIQAAAGVAGVSSVKDNMAIVSGS